ncbi:MAG: PepSY domain-containing protein [Polyangiaceae bacterium]
MNKSLVPAVGFALAFVSATALAQTHRAKVSEGDARSLALRTVPGVVVAHELEHENGRWIYSFEIKPNGETRPLVKEVNIDADTGRIVEVVTERQ